MKKPLYNERELLFFLKKKHRIAFNYLYENYTALLFSIIIRIVGDSHTSEDVLQEVFIKIWNRTDQYDTHKGTLATWMIGIARNAAIDVLRSKGEIMKHKLKELDEISITTKHIRLTVDTIGLRNHISKLPFKYQAVIEMVYYKGYTVVDTGIALSLPEGTVKTHLRTAMKILKGEFNFLDNNGAVSVAF